MKQFIKSLGLVLCLIVLIGMSGTTASKAKSKNTIKVTLTVGKTYTLKMAVKGDTGKNDPNNAINIELDQMEYQ